MTRSSPRVSVIPPELRPYVQGSAAECHTADESSHLPGPSTTSAPVVVVASEEDGTADYFCDFATRRGVETELWRIEDELGRAQLRWPSTPFDPGVGIYFRGAGSQDPRLANALVVLDDIVARHAGPVVNRPGSASLNHSKPLQGASFGARGQAVRCVPTRISLGTRAVRPEASTGPGGHVVKSLSAVRSIVVDASDARLRRDRSAERCPVQLQPRIVGTNVRVHVCGGDVHAIEIVSDEIDYRYATDEVEMRPTRLPVPVSDWCVRTARAEGLELSGIDLIRTPSEQWFCFEVNPTPAYHYFEGGVAEPLWVPISEWLLHRLSSRQHPANPRRTPFN